MAANALAVGDILEVITVIATLDQIGEIVWHAQVSALVAGTPTDFSVAFYVDAQLQAHWKPILSNQCTYRGVSCRILNRIPTLAANYQNANAGLGTAVGFSLPKQTCGLIKWTTGNAGRAFRGRSYIPFPPATFDGADGTPTGPYLAALTANQGPFWGSGPVNVTEGGNIGTIVPGIYHRKAALVPPPLARTITPISNFVVRPLWATQRRRGDEGRKNLAPF
jgi:hypothetical protein